MDNVTDQQEKCMECRECCEHVEYPVTMLSMEVLEYFLFRGETLYIDPSNGVMMCRQYKPCQYLTQSGCSVYETRPEVCRMYLCNEKDKSIRDNKVRACAETKDRILSAVKQYREKQQNGNP